MQGIGALGQQLTGEEEIVEDGEIGVEDRLDALVGGGEPHEAAEEVVGLKVSNAQAGAQTAVGGGLDGGSSADRRTRTAQAILLAARRQRQRGTSNSGNALASASRPRRARSVQPRPRLVRSAQASSTSQRRVSFSLASSDPAWLPLVILRMRYR